MVSIPRTCLRRAPLPRSRTTLPRMLQQRRYIPAPSPTSGPLLERRADRDLPALDTIDNPWRTWRHMPLVVVIIGLSAFGIFNYQKTNHSVISSCLYAMRMNPVARDTLGDEIYFRDSIPWIWGTIDSLHGEVDVTFGVKGTKGKGNMRFRCVRPKGEQFFKTEVWTLQTPDGQQVDLLAAGADPAAETADFA